MTELTYGSYLRLPALLDQQHPQTAGSHDELMFIVAHQVYELWFKLVLHELTDARDRLLAGDPWATGRRLRRCHEIERLLIDQVQVLETMTPKGFHEFRRALGSASGGQSRQYHEIELLSGRSDSTPAEARLPLGPAAPSGRGDQPTVWDAYLAYLDRIGFDVSTAELRREAYAEIARAGTEDGAVWAAHELTEALVDHDESWANWRARHALLVERQLGESNDTGGSTGAGHLWQGARRRFYPELWAARTIVAVPAEH